MYKFLQQNVYADEEDFGGDELAYRLLLNGEKIAEFGDDYHDKGSYKIDGFVEGFCFAKGITTDDIEISSVDIADPNIY